MICIIAMENKQTILFNFSSLRRFRDARWYTYPEFREKTWAVMKDYMARFDHDLFFEDDHSSTADVIGIWLHDKERWEEWGGTVSDTLHDFVIKKWLGIYPIDNDHESAMDIIRGYYPKVHTVPQTIDMGLFTLPPGTTLDSLEEWLRDRKPREVRDAEWEEYKRLNNI